jgi:hypothetical protein
MDSFKLILIVLVLFLGVAATFFFVQHQSTKIQLASAAETNAATISLLRTMGKPCTASGSDFERTRKCIEPLLNERNFKEDGFAQPDDRKGTLGYIVVKNTAVTSYQSEQFTCLFNRVVVQEGCTFPGEIGKGVACRCNFANHCDEGSVIELNYTTPITSGNKTINQSVKVFTKTC